MVLPLAFNIEDSNKLFSVTRSVLEQGSGMMGTFGGMGVGIASIFILIYVFRFGRQLIEGGKFSTQMLWPFVIYILICNFSWVSRPVSSFISSIQGTCVKQCYATNGTAKTIWQEFTEQRDEYLESITTQQEAAKEALEQVEKDDTIDLEGGGGGADAEGEQKPAGILKGLGAKIRVEIVKAYNYIKERALEGLSLTNNIKITSWINYGLAAVLCIILQWIATAVSIAMQSFGGIVVGILMAFGPLTWAFALLPDNTGVIKSWFIRLCQFSLYSPICALINSFTFTIIRGLAQMDGSMSSCLLLFCILVCNILALFQVSTIASMIIEGASGGATIGAGAAAISQIITAGATIGEPGRDTKAMKQTDEQTQILKSIDSKLGGGSDSSSSDGSPTGQNTHS